MMNHNENKLKKHLTAKGFHPEPVAYTLTMQLEGVQMDVYMVNVPLDEVDDMKAFFAAKNSGFIPFDVPPANKAGMFWVLWVSEQREVLE